MTDQAIPLEIERKWLLPEETDIFSAIESIGCYPLLKIVQVYREEEEGLVRYRSTIDTAVTSDATFSRTIKKRLAAGIASEDEQIVDVRAFESAFIAGGPMIVKERYCVQYQERLIEIDRFVASEDKLMQVFGRRRLVLIEVELPGIDAECALPDIFKEAVEVTGKPEWNNDRIAYALSGMPYPEGLDQP